MKGKITELKEKLEKLEERIVFGEIDRDLFEKLSPKLKRNFRKRERTRKASDKFIEPVGTDREVVVTDSKLAALWLKGDEEEKKTLQNILFPDGLIYDRK